LVLTTRHEKITADNIRTLDIIVPYLQRHGYIGIGRVEEKAVPISEFKHNGKSLRDIQLKIKKMFDNHDNDKSKYLIKVEWISAVDSKQAKKATKQDGIYSTPLIKSSLQGQPKTVEYLEKEFGIKFAKLMQQNETATTNI